MERHRTTCRSIRALLALSALSALGCDAEATNDYTAGAGEHPYAPPAESDAGRGDGGGPAEGPACDFQVVTGAACGDQPVTDPCTTPAAPETGTVTGVVTVPAGVMGGGSRPPEGSLVVAVTGEFDLSACPGDPDVPLPAALTILHCADLRDGVQVPFRVEGVPIREQPWFVVPYLDVNPSPETFGVPDTCDLVAFPPATVSVSAAGEVALSAPLSMGFVASTLEMQCGLPACQ